MRKSWIFVIFLLSLYYVFLTFRYRAQNPNIESLAMEGAEKHKKKPQKLKRKDKVPSTVSSLRRMQDHDQTLGPRHYQVQVYRGLVLQSCLQEEKSAFQTL